MHHFSFGLAYFISCFAIFAHGNLTKFQAKSLVGSTLGRAPTIIKLLVHVELVVLVHQQILLQVIGVHVLTVQVVEDVLESFLSTAHLTLDEIVRLVDKDIFQGVSNLLRLQNLGVV